MSDMLKQGFRVQCVFCRDQCAAQRPEPAQVELQGMRGEAGAGRVCEITG